MVKYLWKRFLREDEIPQKLKELKRLAKEILEDEDLGKWLWTHTKSESHYDLIRSIMVDINKYIDGFVEW